MVWAGSPGPIEIICVRWSWKLLAGPSSLPTAPRTVGFITSSRDFGERAIRPPVLRVRRPLKSSAPMGVFSVKGRNSVATSSITSGRTPRSTTTHPSSARVAQISSAEADKGKCLMLIFFFLFLFSVLGPRSVVARGRRRETLATIAYKMRSTVAAGAGLHVGDRDAVERVDDSGDLAALNCGLGIGCLQAVDARGRDCVGDVRAHEATAQESRASARRRADDFEDRLLELEKGLARFAVTHFADSFAWDTDRLVGGDRVVEHR